MTSSRVFDMRHNPVSCFWDMAFRNVRSSNMTFCLPIALHALLKWHLLGIYKRYPCVYRNLVATNQSGKAPFEKKEHPLGAGELMIICHYRGKPKNQGSQKSNGWRSGLLRAIGYPREVSGKESEERGRERQRYARISWSSVFDLLAYYLLLLQTCFAEVVRHL